MSAEDSGYDVVVIGAGPGGYPAAIRAAQRGAKVALAEKEKVGGTCLNWGCIPTKALLASAELVDKAKEAQAFGLKIEVIEPDWPAIMERKNRITETLTGGVKQLLKANGVTLIQGTASITPDKKVSVKTDEGGQLLETGKIIIATGSDPAELPTFNFSEPSVMTSTDGLALETVPESLIIVGSGVIGCEFATVFSAMGTTITMLELMDRILPTEDSRVSKQMRSVLRKRGIDIRTKTTVEKVLEYRPDGIKVELSTGDTLEADKLLISIGRKLNSGGLGLEEAGVELDKRGTVIVNEKMETSVDGIYAIGDVTGGILLAHTATAEGLVAAENATGGNKSIDESIVPACIFTTPEIGTVGLNTDKAADQGIEVNISRFQFGGLGKALAMGEDMGFVQLVLDKESDRILGAQIMGPHASDLIHEIAIAMKLGATSEDIAETIHAHPSLPEAILEAAEAAHGRAIHVAPAKKKS
ncbi:MAG: dihydrolipoyl dehydrogenase [Actinobacteria bacterium]|nr:dihydrolipoyl dehydrogenase [Actinomycetota bacterium]